MTYHPDYMPEGIAHVNKPAARPQGGQRPAPAPGGAFPMTGDWGPGGAAGGGGMGGDFSGGGGPTSPDNDPVLAALNQVLMSAAGPPDHAAYLAPFAGAETSVRDAYAKALPKIAAAYDQVRKDLQMTHDRATAERGQNAGQRQVSMDQSKAAVNDDSALRGLIQMSGGNTQDAGLASIIAGAKAQQDSNRDSLALSQNNETAFSNRIGTMSNEMHSDRQGTSGLINQSAVDLAESNQARGLSAIASGKANAEAEYAQLVQKFEEQKAKIQLQIAEYSADKPLNDLKMAKEMGELMGGGGDTKGQLPNVDDFDDLARKSPTAFKAFSDVITAAGGKADRLKAEGTLNESIQAMKDEGNFDEATNSIIYEGKRISIPVLRRWMDMHYSRLGK